MQVEVAANGGNPLSPAWLWQQHNEHRLVIPKLFLAADLRLFQARQAFLLASIFVIQLLHWGLLSWSMWVLGGWRGALWRTGAGLAAFCLFCPAQWQNLIWGFQVCFVLPQLLATVSFVALLLYWMESPQQPDKRPPSKFLVVSVLAALGAYLFSVQRQSPVAAAGGGSALSSIAPPGCPEFCHHGDDQHCALSVPLRSATRPCGPNRLPAHTAYVVEVLRTVFLQHLGAPQYWHLGSHRTCWVGHCGRVACPCTVLRSRFSPLCDSTGPHPVVLRRYRADHGNREIEFRDRAGPCFAVSDGSLLFWCCLGLLWLGATFFARSRVRYAFRVAQVCLLLIFARGAVLAGYPITEVRKHAFAQNAVTAALITGVHDPATLSMAYPQMDMLHRQCLT